MNEVLMMLKKYRVAASRMLDRWAEGNPVVKAALWADLHGLETEALEIIERAEKKANGIWQPIETAPVGDEDYFLVYGHRDDFASPFVVRGSIMHSARKPDTPKHLALHYLTHWMPLPEPPRKE